MIKAIRRWWRPHRYQIEFFRGQFGMGGYHDHMVFNDIKPAEERLDYLSNLQPYQIQAELGINFVPSFLRILESISPPPYRRLMNKFKIPLIRFTLFGRRWYI